MNKLKEFIKYPNATLMLLNVDGDKYYKNDETFIEGIRDFIDDVEAIGGDRGYALLLRPIESITDYEAIKILQNMCIQNIEKNKAWEYIVKLVKDIYEGDPYDEYDTHDKLHVSLILSLIDYLRSINIDIDGLKKKGWAVYE